VFVEGEDEAAAESDQLMTDCSGHEMALYQVCNCYLLRWAYCHTYRTAAAEVDHIRINSSI